MARDRSNIQTDWNSAECSCVCGQIEKELKERFEQIDQIAEYNRPKVAATENRVKRGVLNYASGYGYDDQGRDTLEEVCQRIPYERACTPADRMRDPCHHRP